MSIQILPEEVKSRLRSGIAITNPRQCVEELVLNSLDANANCIAVRVNFKCFNIQVVDNGTGLTEDQLKLIGERYATNKCHSVRDLGKIQTYGFRGEALASILQMCGTLQIVTRTRENPRTFCKIFNLGRVVEIKEIAESRPSAGTTFTVYNFLYNLPVRRQNVQVTLTLEDIRARLQSIALIHPQVAFTLCDDVSGTTCLRIRRCNSVLANFSQIFGSSRAKNLKSVREKIGSVTVEGYVSTGEGFHNKNLQFLYVNKRLVLKTKLHESINSVLAKHYSLQCADFTKKYYAIFVLNIVCPSNEYDIFFEPSKTHIEFDDWNLVTKCVLNSIRRALTSDEDFDCERYTKLDLPSNKNDEKSDLLALGAQIATHDINTALISLPAKRNLIHPSDNTTLTERLQSQSSDIATVNLPINRNEELTSEPSRKLLKIPQECVVTTYSDYVNGIKKNAKSQLCSKIPPQTSVTQVADGHDSFFPQKRKLIKIPNEFITTTYSDFINELCKDNHQEEIVEEMSQEESPSRYSSFSSSQSVSSTRSTAKGIDQRNVNSLRRFSYDKLTPATKSEKSNNNSEKKTKNEDRSNFGASLPRHQFPSSSTFMANFANRDISRNRIGDDTSSKRQSKILVPENQRNSYCADSFCIKNNDQNSVAQLAQSDFEQITGENCEEIGATKTLRNTYKIVEEINSPFCDVTTNQDTSYATADNRGFSLANTETESQDSSEILSSNDVVAEHVDDNIIDSQIRVNTCENVTHNQVEKYSQSSVTANAYSAQTSFDQIISKTTSIIPSNHCDADSISVKENEEDQVQDKFEAIANAEENISEKAISSHQCELAEKTGDNDQTESENADWIVKEDSNLGKNIYIHKVTGNSFFDTPLQFGAENDHELPSVPMSFNLGSAAVPFTVHDRSIHPFTTSTMVDKNTERTDGKELASQLLRDMLDGPRLTTSSLQSIQTYKSIQSYKFSRSMLEKVQVINQVDDKFIVCFLPDSRLIVLFDQHAVHERIRLEQLQKESEMSCEESKSTVPHVLVIPPRKIIFDSDQVSVVRAFLSAFARWGFELSIDQYDPKCILVHTMPIIFAGKEANVVFRDRSAVMTSLIENTIRDIISLLQTTGSANVTMPKSLLYVFNSFACRGAIKFGDTLELKECEYLIRALGTCYLPFQCAHGRPSITALADLNRVRRNKRTKTKPQLKKLRCFQQL